MKKLSMFIFIIFLALSCSSQLLKQEASGHCLNFEPEQVQLKGLLYSKSFPGPPNYEDIKNGDKEEIYWLIKVVKPFCVNESPQLSRDKISNQSEVQLVISTELDFYKTKKSLLNKKVIVQGTLFPQMTGHHKTTVLIDVKSIEEANE
jgi:hypothetical protein